MSWTPLSDSYVFKAQDYKLQRNEVKFVWQQSTDFEIFSISYHVDSLSSYVLWKFLSTPYMRRKICLCVSKYFLLFLQHLNYKQTYETLSKKSFYFFLAWPWEPYKCRLPCHEVSLREISWTKQIEDVLFFYHPWTTYTSGRVTIPFFAGCNLKPFQI